MIARFFPYSVGAVAPTLPMARTRFGPRAHALALCIVAAVVARCVDTHSSGCLFRPLWGAVTEFHEFKVRPLRLVVVNENSMPAPAAPSHPMQLHCSSYQLR